MEGASSEADLVLVPTGAESAASASATTPVADEPEPAQHRVSGASQDFVCNGIAALRTGDAATPVDLQGDPPNGSAELTPGVGATADHVPHEQSPASRGRVASDHSVDLVVDILSGAEGPQSASPAPDAAPSDASPHPARLPDLDVAGEPAGLCRQAQPAVAHIFELEGGTPAVPAAEIPRALDQPAHSSSTGSDCDLQAVATPCLEQRARTRSGSQSHAAAETPVSQASPHHGVWLTEPTSIDEPLLLLDAEEDSAAVESTQPDAEATGAGTSDTSPLALEAALAELRAELAQARAANKAERAQAEELGNDAERAEREVAALREGQVKLEKENAVLREQLQDHHGIMAADWAQTLGFQERLRQEEAAHARLAAEVAEMRESLSARSEEAAALRADASRWQLLSCNVSQLAHVSMQELDAVLEVTVPGIAKLSAEMRSRCRTATVELFNELQQQLCLVCCDAKKSVLFIPCLHICVCEGCRVRLRPYRCPMCKEPVQSHLGRVHF